jgi:hypothetical protein
MKTLSKEAEALILSAIKDVCDDVSSGSSPTDAVVKVANDMDLSRNFIKLVTTGYNTGATTYQREKSGGVLTKLADFPLADTDKAIEAVFPTKVESPSILKAASAVSSEYSMTPRTNTRAARQHLEKVASADLTKLAGLDKRSEEPVKYGESSDRMKHAYCKALDEKRALEEKRFQYSVSQNDLLLALGTLGDHMKQSDWKFQDVDFAITQRFGKAGSAVMDYVRERNGVKEKRAEAPSTTSRIVKWGERPFSLVADCIKAATEMYAKQHDYRNSQSAMTEKVGELLHPFAQDSAPKATVLGGVSSPVKTAGLFSMMMGASIGQAMKPKEQYDETIETPTDISGKTIDDLEDPEHDNQLRAIQARTMLQDLMSNDEVISGYDDNEVIEAYNEVAQLSPRSAGQTAIIRPLLRKRLTQGGMEPFEAAELTNVEKSLSEAQNPRISDMDKASNVLTGKKRSGILG